MWGGSRSCYILPTRRPEGKAGSRGRERMTGHRGDQPKGQGPAMDESRILLEFHRVGNAVKVSAVDPDSLVEASIVGDPALGEQALAKLAIRKLRYVLGRRARTRDEESPASHRSGGRGTVV